GGPGRPGAARQPFAAGRAPVPGAGRAAGRAARGAAAAPAWRTAAGGDRPHHRGRPGDGEVAAALCHGPPAREAASMSRHAPLTPEELELRRQLEAAAGPGPSPQLDARVLAAARQAAAPPAHPATATAPVARGWRRARRRRWIAPLGLAASLVLAFGVAWQLREPPVPGQALPAAAPAAADRSAPAAAQAVHAPAAEEAAPAADAGAADSAATPAVQRPAAAVARKLPPPPPDDAAVAMPRAPLPAAPAPVAAMAEPAPAAPPAAEVAAAAAAAPGAQDLARPRQAAGAAAPH